MELIIPFVEGGLRPEVEQLGESLGARFVEMTRLTSYFDLLAALWTGERSFVLLEEDVLPSIELLEEMAACPHEWCGTTFVDSRSVTYRVHLSRPTELERAKKRVDTALGLNKFSAQLQRRVSDAVRRAMRVVPSRAWDSLDYALIDRVLMEEAGLEPHIHLPPVVHLKDYSKPPLVQGNLEAALRGLLTGRLMLETEPTQSRLRTRGTFPRPWRRPCLARASLCPSGRAG